MPIAYVPFGNRTWVLDLLICLGALLGGSLTLAWVRARAEPKSWERLLAWTFGSFLGLAPFYLWGLASGSIWGFFLISRALWVNVTEAWPAALAVAAFHKKRWALLAPAALLLILKLDAEFIEPSRLEVLKVEVPVAGLKSPVRVAHFSDLQTDALGEKEAAAREAANAFEPDVVTFAGDVLNDLALETEVLGYLEGFRAKQAKLFVGGDVDGPLDRERFEARTGFTWLDRRVRGLRLGGTEVAFLGFGLHDFREGPALVRRLIAESPKAQVRLALSHRPDEAFALQGQAVPVLFTGHTHGGQIQIPFFGPPVKLTGVSREAAAGGVHRFLDQTLVLSRGLGWEGHVAPRVRLFCRPQLLLVTLIPRP